MKKTKYLSLNVPELTDPPDITKVSENFEEIDAEFKKQNEEKAAQDHKHNASDITDGTLPLARGGTGASNAAEALANLGGFPKTGGELSGGLEAKFANIDLSKANNGVTATTYPTTMNLLDKEGRIMARSEAIINPNGDVSVYTYARNYDTSGNNVGQKGIKITVDKAGLTKYEVSDPAAFRLAIGAAAEGWSWRPEITLTRSSNQTLTDAGDILFSGIDGNFIGGNNDDFSFINGGITVRKAMTVLVTICVTCDFTASGQKTLALRYSGSSDFVARSSQSTQGGHVNLTLQKRLSVDANTSLKAYLGAAGTVLGGRATMTVARVM